MEKKALKDVFCGNEYDFLKRVAVCRPKFMTISNAINETQKAYIHESFDVKKAVVQHEKFCSFLIDKGVELVELPALAEYPEQVFTRDIGFTLGSTVFISNMRFPIRKGEEQLLEDWLRQNQSSFQSLQGKVEGGDVMIDDRTVLVGISERTAEASADEMIDLLPDFTIKKLPIDSRFLHLDCVLNLLSKDVALIYSPAFKAEDVLWLKTRYRLIEVSAVEQFSLGTNILSIGNKTVISLPNNNLVNSAMRQNGFAVEEIDFSEVIKSGGSFRCCSMPLLREQSGY